MAETPFLSEEDGLRTLRGLARPSSTAIAILDFDETLLTVNSTVLYLDSLRPRAMASAVVLGLRVLRPWRWLPAWRADPVYVDFWLRVLVTSVLLPWSLPLWRRRAPALGARLHNRELLGALRASGRQVHVGTFGIRSVVGPLLRGIAPEASLTVAADLLRAPHLRAEGKLPAFERALGATAVAGAVVVTDSLDDDDLLAGCDTPVLARWGAPPAT